MIHYITVSILVNFIKYIFFIFINESKLCSFPGPIVIINLWKKIDIEVIMYYVEAVPIF